MAAQCPECGADDDFIQWTKEYAADKGWIYDWLTYDHRAAAGDDFYWLECPACQHRWIVYFSDDLEGSS